MKLTVWVMEPLLSAATCQTSWAVAVAGALAAVGAAASRVGVAGAGAHPLASSASASIAAPRARGVNTTFPPKTEPKVLALLVC